MDNPRKGRVVEQHFLNLPGFHAGAYVRAYVEDTSGQAIRPAKGDRPAQAPSPDLVLELSDCYRRIDLEFSVDDAENRLNSFHKIDTLIAALVAFRDGMAAEADLRRRRLAEIDREPAGPAPLAAAGSSREPAAGTNRQALSHRTAREADVGSVGQYEAFSLSERAQVRRPRASEPGLARSKRRDQPEIQGDGFSPPRAFPAAPLAPELHVRPAPLTTVRLTKTQPPMQAGLDKDRQRQNLKRRRLNDGIEGVDL